MSHLIMGCCMHVAESRLCSQVVSVSAVQRLSAEDPSGHKPFRTRNGYREGQHRLQLRHARGLRHVSPQGTYPRLCKCFQISEVARLSRSRPVLRWLVRGASAPRVWPSHSCQTRPMPKILNDVQDRFEVKRVRVARGDRHFHLQWVVGLVLKPWV